MSLFRNLIMPPNKDKHTILLLHCEDFSDSSMYKNTLGKVSATISSNQKKFGTNAIYFNTQSNYIKTNLSSLIRGNSPFTIDFWVYPIYLTNYNTCISIGQSGSNQFEGTGGVISYGSNGILNYYCSAYKINGSIGFNVDEWHHVAFIGNGTNIKLYINGIQSGNTYNYNYNFDWTEFYIGCNKASRFEYFRGYIDEIRVSDVVRWTSNFIPPTEPYIG